MVGDSQCWDGSTPGMTRVIFVVVAEAVLCAGPDAREIGYNYGKGGSAQGWHDSCRWEQVRARTLRPKRQALTTLRFVPSGTYRYGRAAVGVHVQPRQDEGLRDGVMGVAAQTGPMTWW